MHRLTPCQQADFYWHSYKPVEWFLAVGLVEEAILPRIPDGDGVPLYCRETV